MYRQVAHRWFRKEAAKKITDKTPIEGFDEYQKVEPTKAVQMDEAFEVETLEGTMKGQKGDYLAQGVDGERWPVKKSIFERTHKMKKAMQRIAALVGTDTATIYAIAPEMLHKIVRDGQWEALSRFAWGSRAGALTEEGFLGTLDQMDLIIRKHGGAIFTTGADGDWDVKVLPKSGMAHPIREHGYLPPYGTPDFVRVARRVASRCLGD